MQWTWEQRYLFKVLISFPLGIYQEVELLDHLVVLFLVFWGNSILSSIMYIPTRSAQEFPFSTSLPTHIFLIIVILTVMRWYVIIVLTYNFLMISDVEHLFMYLLAIYMSFQVLCSFFKKFVYFIYFIFGCIGFLLLRAGFLQLQRAGATLRCGA